MLMKTPILAALFVSVAMTAANLTAIEETHTFKRIQLSDQFWSEGANFGDLNNDGENDMISGPWWWEGPDFKKRHEFYPADDDLQAEARPDDDRHGAGLRGRRSATRTRTPTTSSPGRYDFNKDGWNDILIIGFPGTDTSWFENPKGKDAHWPRHKIFEQTDNESPTFTDLTGDGKPELVCITKGQYGYATPDWNDPAKPWTFHPHLAEQQIRQLHARHGRGRREWRRAARPAGEERLVGTARVARRRSRLEVSRRSRWAPAGSQMYAYDVNGDGLNDIITALAAHGFGLAWYRAVSRRQRDQVPRARHHEQGAARQQVRREVLRAPRHRPRRHGRRRPQGHRHRQALLVARAHGRSGPQRRGGALLVQARADADKSVDFIPYLIDKDSGVGTQVWPATSTATACRTSSSATRRARSCTCTKRRP